MQDINCWQSKFEPCGYSDKLFDLLESLNKKASNFVDITEVKKASYYARKYHGTQLRKSLEPYYSHPLEVNCLFLTCASKENWKYYKTDLMVTAILHDTIEDTALTSDMIAAIFGEIIARNVEDLTRIKNGIKISAAETLDILYSQGKEDILHIKIFDRLHNMRTIGFMSHEKQIKIAHETKDRFIPYAIIFELDEVAEELKEICNKIIKSYDQEQRFCYINQKSNKLFCFS